MTKRRVGESAGSVTAGSAFSYQLVALIGDIFDGQFLAYPNLEPFLLTIVTAIFTVSISQFLTTIGISQANNSKQSSEDSE